MSKNHILTILVIIILVLVGVLVYNRSPKQAEKPSKATFAEKVNHSITGIEPGAGIMINTEKAMEKYSLKKAGWNLKKSSSAAMLAALQDSVKKREPIIATVWEPHAAFSVANIRKLKDPKHIYNNPASTTAFLKNYAPEWKGAEVKSDVLASVVYKGFKQDAPAAYEFLHNFNIPASTQSNWIYKYSVEEVEAEKVAKNYISDHQDLIEKWKSDGEAKLGKSKLTVGFPPWPGATVKSEVVAKLLRDIGYKVETKGVDAGVVYTAIANQKMDITVAGWLPTTHQEYWQKKGDKLEIAGINVTTTWLGLGVPSYVDKSIQSIEDLK